MKPKPFIASWKDIDPGKKIKFTIKKALNGKMVMSFKIDDWIYTLNVLADKDYQGSYFPIVVENIEGAKQNIKADTISGLKKLNDYSMEVTLKRRK